MSNTGPGCPVVLRFWYLARLMKRSASGRSPSSLPQRVRIIGGQWRGTRIGVPSGTSVRPTPDRVRETVFNWLGPLVNGARCVDLCAGTGALGLEALSRGARHALFIERDRRLAGQLRDQLRRLGGNGEVIEADALAWLRRRQAPAEASAVPAPGAQPAAGAAQAVVGTPETVKDAGGACPGPFDIAFADPPYLTPVEPMLALLTPQLSPAAVVYLERPRADGLPDAPAGMFWHRQATAADVAYGLLMMRQAATMDAMSILHRSDR